MGLYNTKGLYNSYDRNHAERDKLDYYATPPGETLNILKTLGYDFSDCTILEPSCGGGHMAKDIYEYCNDTTTITCTDIHEQEQIFEYPHFTGEEYDFLADDYPIDTADWIIMNPPYATIEPFVIRALEIADKGVIMLARLQFLEGKKRFENILSTNPPTDIYVYVDRIQCWKAGIKPTGSSSQAYAWFVWRKTENNEFPQVHWMKRI